jgi:hypothetical protein
VVFVTMMDRSPRRRWLVALVVVERTADRFGQRMQFALDAMPLGVRVSTSFSFGYWWHVIATMALSHLYLP